MRHWRMGTARPFATAAAAALSCGAFAAALAEPPERPDPGRLEDVQIGEQGLILRIALICHDRCAVAPGDGAVFSLPGVAADLDIDLETRSRLARRIRIASKGGSSVLMIDPKARLNEARIVTCRSESGPAPCVEYRFEAAVAAAKPATRPAPMLRADSTKTEGAISRPDILPHLGSLTPAPGAPPGRTPPALRDEPAAALLVLPRFAPPERLDAPAPGAPHYEALDVRPRLAAVRVRSVEGGGSFDFTTEAVAILGKSFDAGSCAGAKARLDADAWALDAMIDNAFCKAGAGDFDAADADFARLLAYTPDNYEALVGRGLIAIRRGERGRGQGYFQEALNALPPIRESDRIVAAMGRN